MVLQQKLFIKIRNLMLSVIIKIKLLANTISLTLFYSTWNSNKVRAEKTLSYLQTKPVNLAGFYKKLIYFNYSHYHHNGVTLCLFTGENSYPKTDILRYWPGRILRKTFEIHSTLNKLRTFEVLRLLRTWR